MLNEYSQFASWVIAATPCAPEFVASLSASPKVFGSVFERYKENARSSQWATSNAFAYAAPSVDISRDQALAELYPSQFP